MFIFEIWLLFRLLVEQAKAGSIFPLGMLTHRLVGMRDLRIHRCVARTIAILILDFWSLKFRNRTFLISWPGFLYYYRGHVHETLKAEKWSSQAWRYFFFSRPGERRTASSFRWMLDGASRFAIRMSRMQSVWWYQIFLISRSPRSSVSVDIPCLFNTSLRPQ